MQLKEVSHINLFSALGTNNEYLEWNRLIAESLFKEEMADRDVILYVTKEEVIRLGKNFFDLSDDKVVWENFISAIRCGVRNYILNKNDLLSKALDAYSYWVNLDENEKNKLIYPSYLIYLVFFVMPLTEYQGNINANNYQEPVNNFYRTNALPELQYQNKQKNWLMLWENLEKWSQGEKNRELGIFRIKLNNEHWKYVGLPLSQCLISPFSLKKLPQIFSAAKFVPGLNISEKMLVNLLLKYQFDLKLKNSVIKLLNESSNDLKDTIVEIVRKVYINWDGNTNLYNSKVDDNRSKPVKEFFISRLFANLKFDIISKEIEITFRIKYNPDIPEDLELNKISCTFRNPLWSNKLPFKFSKTFECEDQFNKWLVRFPDKDIRLFVDGSLNIGSGNWIETDQISRVHEMYLLCKNELLPKVVEWGSNFQNGNFKEIDYKNIPENFSLFYFKNPPFGLNDFKELQLESVKKTELIKGLRIKNSRFLNKYLPEVLVQNSTGDEIVYIEFVDGQQVVLEEKIDSDTFNLPVNNNYEKSFCIKIKDAPIEKYEKNYSIEHSSIPEELLTKKYLPKRDKFGNVNVDESGSFAQGSQVTGIDTRTQNTLIGLFKPSCNSSIIFKINRSKEKYNSDNDSLLLYLTTKHKSKTEQFYSAFDNILVKKFKYRTVEFSENITAYKRYSLNLYDYLGFIDYDYVSKNIVVNPPLLILIPPAFNLTREFLLIGARTEQFVNRLNKYCNKYGIQTKVEKQFDENSFLLLPDRITLVCNDINIKSVVSVAKECGIEFSPDKYPQLGLMEFSTNIIDYEKYMLTQNDLDNFDYKWSKKIFNSRNYSFEKCGNDSYDKTYTLVQYELNSFTFEHRLWIKGVKYSIDKNWGRYLIVKYFHRNVILYNKDELKIAIPLKMPLPRLLAESLLLLSGWAPEKKIIEHNDIKFLFNIYQNIPETFATKFFDKLSQKIIYRRF